jgi:hypothetical protein
LGQSQTSELQVQFLKPTLPGPQVLAHGVSVALTQAALFFTAVTHAANGTLAPPAPIDPPEPIAVDPPDSVAVDPPEPIAVDPPEPVAVDPPDPVAGLLLPQPADATAANVRLTKVPAIRAVRFMKDFSGDEVECQIDSPQRVQRPSTGIG